MVKGALTHTPPFYRVNTQPIGSSTHPSQANWVCSVADYYITSYIVQALSSEHI